MESKLPKFIHFVIDDKFINDSYRCFQNAGLTENIFYYICEKKYTLNYINKEAISVITQKDAKQILLSLTHNETIVLHSLYSLPAKLSKYIHPQNKVIWYAWGFDLYSNDYPLKPLIRLAIKKLHPITHQALNGALFLNNIVKRIKYYLSINSQSSKNDYIHLISRVNFFAGVFPCEYDLLREQYSFFTAQRIKHDYIHPEEFSEKDINKPQSEAGRNILLGNSASYLCNHLDLLHDLYQKVKSRDFLIYCPLSYGGNKYYNNKVIREGRKLFGDKFIPLMDFLPFDEYTKIIQSCGNVILGYERQAATCNCLTALWNGLKLFVPKSSMNFKEYKEIEGLCIYSIEDDLNDITLKSHLNYSIVEERKKISKTYSYDRWKLDLMESLKLINQLEK